MDPKIIFEDEEILVLDKSSGWITNDAETTKDQPTIQGWLRRSFTFPIFSFQELRNGIVHRLDKETSGILLVAKTKKAFEELQRQFKSREVQKTYTALAHGAPEPPRGEISAPLGRLSWRRDRFGVLPGGREASTEYKVITNYTLKTDSFSLLELFPKTGRTHQIRVHLKHLGHPIVSDEFYNKPKIDFSNLYLFLLNDEIQSKLLRDEVRSKFNEIQIELFPENKCIKTTLS